MIYYFRNVPRGTLQKWGQMQATVWNIWSLFDINRDLQKPCWYKSHKAHVSLWILHLLYFKCNTCQLGTQRVILVIWECVCLNTVLSISAQRHPASGHSRRLTQFLFVVHLCSKGVQTQELACRLKSLCGLHRIDTGMYQVWLIKVSTLDSV